MGRTIRKAVVAMFWFVARRAVRQARPGWRRSAKRSNLGFR